MYTTAKTRFNRSDLRVLKVMYGDPDSNCECRGEGNGKWVFERAVFKSSQLTFLLNIQTSITLILHHLNIEVNSN